ncbi:hypothetical protein SLS56_010706 [Neofusicoccum ribis]|uniref:homogentisate 1,2-dioxygenase n=1 Tax=Neofusicoccum ribis TaxID=45134 RepID=A0ABR3SDQ5_9PEZI
MGPPKPTLGATARHPHTTAPTPTDPYTYQQGFGNRFASEALPNTLPRTGNTPQRCAYDLFSEQLNATPFIHPRATQLHTWLYRIRPSVAHRPLTPCAPAYNPHLVADFTPANPAASFSPNELAWPPPPGPPARTTDFVQGLRTIAGTGSATAQQGGLALHAYAAGASMAPRSAFCCNDGDLLVAPSEGAGLDLRTEMGWLRVRAGEVCVVPAGVKVWVGVVGDGEEGEEPVARGYVLELFGAHFELPELGPLGANGMAAPRDFMAPVASFMVDVDGGDWEVVYKHGGRLWSGVQPHAPFDVVAWHGNLAPCKYALDRFVGVANTETDQADPTVYCVLIPGEPHKADPNANPQTAKSKAAPGSSLIDFLAFQPRWSTTRNTFRPPYFHRNTAAELMGLAFGAWPGSGHALAPGGLSFEPPYMPHGESHARWADATTRELAVERVGEGALAFMWHVSAPVAVTEWARARAGPETLQKPEWEGLGDYGFLARLEEVERDLKEMGLPGLGEGVRVGRVERA